MLSFSYIQQPVTKEKSVHFLSVRTWLTSQSANELQTVKATQE